MTPHHPLIFYIDVDDTLVRYAGTKRMPIPSVVAHVRRISSNGRALLYCWSANGADYARSVAKDLGIEACFTAFLPKPNVMIDDQSVSDWKRLITLHPMELDIDASLEDYASWIDQGSKKDRG